MKVLEAIAILSINEPEFVQATVVLSRDDVRTLTLITDLYRQESRTPHARSTAAVDECGVLHDFFSQLLSGLCPLAGTTQNPGDASDGARG